MTRAMRSLLEGRVGTAFLYNPLGVMILPVLAGWLFLRGRSREKGGWARIEWTGKWLWGMLLVLVAYGILRNLVDVPSEIPAYRG